MASSRAPRRSPPRSARLAVARHIGAVSTLAATLVAVLTNGACGKGGADRAPGGRETGGSDAGPAARARPDLSTPLAALSAAVKALGAGDLAALDACLTAEGAVRVRRDLAAWKDLLADPTTGPRAVSRIPPARDEAEKSAYVAGFGGEPAGLLRMLARADAASGAEARADVGPFAVDAVRVEGERVRPDGTRRRAVLVRDGATWRVDRLAL